MLSRRRILLFTDFNTAVLSKACLWRDWRFGLFPVAAFLAGDSGVILMAARERFGFRFSLCFPFDGSPLFYYLLSIVVILLFHLHPSTAVMIRLRENA